MSEEKKSESKKGEKEGKSVQKVSSSRAITPFEEMERVMDRMERLFDDFFPGRWRARRAMAPFEEMDRLFEDFVPRGWLRPFRREWPAWGRLAPFEERWPRIDVIDRDEEIVIQAEVPGVSKEDLDVSMTEDSVTIKGSATREEKEEKEDYYRREMARGEFTRTIPLPVEVDGTKAQATFKDGVMELVLPKVEKTARRKIKVE